MLYPARMIRAVVLDVGETLIRDDRGWATWADWLGVPRHTLSALVGAVVAQGRDNAEALRLVRPGIDIVGERAAMEARGVNEQLDESDLYPDVRPAFAALRQRGVRVVIAGNQTACTGQLLRDLGLPVDAVATSGEWGVAKPEPGFFALVLELAGTAPGETVYVGDHPANDTGPAKAAGLRAAHLRRGPWGHLWSGTPEAAAADWQIDSLHDLVRLVGT
ncbi:HAD-superfamily hydrolase, subfamily IA [Streptomyces himastatinicus ATCC 53653]|uniref:HAD-superfamily hydrolase, subfamily IA n=2 Tax=Streptomyces violaceusniger group TaxID=2839105 RepID=D9WDG9_9ACTN|nr:HAD-superfamily hydrolase, subfamily IA [Streptomyces himastatinicus ATCC 53653]